MVMTSMSMLNDAPQRRREHGGLRPDRRSATQNTNNSCGFARGDSAVLQKPLPSAGGEERPISVDVDREGVNGEERGDGEGHCDEAAMELIPVVRESTVLPAQRLAGVAEREPGDRGADEDILNHGLELPRPARRDDHPLALGPPTKAGHRELTSDEQQADPERDAAPERDVVEIVPLTGDPVDRDQSREQQQLVGDGVEQDADVR